MERVGVAVKATYFCEEIIAPDNTFDCLFCFKLVTVMLTNAFKHHLLSAVFHFIAGLI